MAVMELLVFQLGEVPQLLAKIYLALIGSQVVAVVVDFMDLELAVMVAVEMVLDKMFHKVMLLLELLTQVAVAVAAAQEQRRQITSVKQAAQELSSSNTQ